MPTARVTSKGQITLPRQIREALHIRPGDRVDFVLDESGVIHLQAGTADIRELQGILHRPGRKAVSLEAMEEAVRRRGQR